MDFLRSAAAYLDRSAISSAYNIYTSNPQSSSTSAPPSGHYSPPVRIGLWAVHRATHATTHKLVSVWTFEKKLDGSAGSSKGGQGRLEKAVDVLKKEASSLSRLRHPCILEVVEPLEETRTQLIFATEPVTASLRDAGDQSLASPSGSRSRRTAQASSLELDEVEIQKGLLQIGKGLQFLHESAKLVHSNLTPEAVIINAKGDWKISGFGLSSYLTSPTGEPTNWVFPEHDSRMPEPVQKDLDYIAPEYALDEVLAPANDMWSLGCIIYGIHTRGGPPYRTEGKVEGIRRGVANIGVVRAGWSRLPEEVQDVLGQLLTPSPSQRLTASSFLTSRYFSSNVLVSTLAFLDRETFNSKQREEQVQFMKGLIRVLPQFSDKIVRRKILPSLLEETRKHILLPFLLPNIFFIAKKMEIDEFRDTLLPHLTPLFAIRDPPQSMLTLLDNLDIFQSKATPQMFREDVMPLIYAALESDMPQVQEKALRVIPGLAETLEYTHVKQVLFPKVQTVFSKTTMLSVKVNTLICFHSMVKILDKFTLTEKLVPLLAKIKTKEPAVMIATLAVHEEMGKRVEIVAIATLILPQLWAMSIGPLLNADQFARFMTAIDSLSARVREEHSRHLAEVRRLEQSTTATSAAATGLSASGEVDFEALVKGAGNATGGTASVPPDPFGASPMGTPRASPALPGQWGDDSGRASPLPNSTGGGANGLGAGGSNGLGARMAMRLQTGSASKAASLLGTRQLPKGSFDSALGATTTAHWTAAGPEGARSFGGARAAGVASPTGSVASNNGSSWSALPPPLPPPMAGPSATGIMQPMRATQPRVSLSAAPPPSSGANYNITLAPQAPLGTTAAAAGPLGLSQYPGLPPLQPQPSSSFGSVPPASAPPPKPLAPMQPKAATGGWNVVPPPGFNPGSVLQPAKTPQNQALADFDPFA